MNPLQDFSKPRTPSPAPVQPPPIAPVRSRWRPSRSVLVTVAVVASIGSVLAYTLAGASRTGPPNPRFCELSVALENAVTDVGAPPVGVFPDSVQPERLKAQMDRLNAQLDELVRLAPSKIGGDVKLVVTDLRAAADGDAKGVHSLDFVSAEKRIAKLQKSPQGCPRTGGGPGAGEG